MCNVELHLVEKDGNGKKIFLRFSGSELIIGEKSATIKYRSVRTKKITYARFPLEIINAIMIKTHLYLSTSETELLKESK